jgi:hypothetical protein
MYFCELLRVTDWIAHDKQRFIVMDAIALLSKAQKPN